MIPSKPLVYTHDDSPRFHSEGWGEPKRNSQRLGRFVAVLAVALIVVWVVENFVR